MTNKMKSMVLEAMVLVVLKLKLLEQDNAGAYR